MDRCWVMNKPFRMSEIVRITVWTASVVALGVVLLVGGSYYVVRNPHGEIMPITLNLLANNDWRGSALSLHRLQAVITEA